MSKFEKKDDQKIVDFREEKSEIKPHHGRFNFFKLKKPVGKLKKPLTYQRRDFYKIMLVIGASKVHYADKVLEVKKQALSFSNPFIPYNWEHDKALNGFYCIFDQDFFYQFGDLTKYSIFNTKGSPIYELDENDLGFVKNKFKQIEEELNSDYEHKYDLIRNLIFELIHFATKAQPVILLNQKNKNASERIANMFLELLERQFPVDETHPKIHLKSPNDFANQLNVHVNHLNKALKEITNLTTSQLIANRIIQEAKILLEQSHWNVSEISYALGFNESSHFNNFFKKHTNQNPSQFRHNKV